MFARPDGKPWDKDAWKKPIKAPAEAAGLPTTTCCTLRHTTNNVRRSQASRVCAPRRLLSDGERRAIVEYLATRPTAGELLEGTGGVRKLRWARDGRGKSGGVRVICYFHSERMPLYLLTMFAKNERANLSRSERNALAGLVDELVSIWLTR